MADQNLVYYALLFGAVLAYPIVKLVLKQLGQFSGTPGSGTVVGDGYGGKDATYTLADVAKHNKQDDLWVRRRIQRTNERTDHARAQWRRSRINETTCMPQPRAADTCTRERAHLVRVVFSWFDG